jgi:hypothetical protein
MGRMDERDRIPSLGECHPRAWCWLCGARRGLRLVVVPATRAQGLECSDPIACLRHRQRARYRDLLGIPAA